jgi:hypothetical protein
MVTPLYLLLIPVLLIIALFGWGLYRRLVVDRHSDLRKSGKSDLEKAQAMEDHEEQTEAREISNQSKTNRA